MTQDIVLAGGGEMGTLMRSVDWSRTPLGAVERWPQSLRTAVSMMLESAFGMVVAWGPDFLFLYNDRYRPVLGATKHPAALGRPAREIFPEVWNFIGPLFRKALGGTAVALDDVLIPLDRNGYLEDCYFTLSYSPIRDESGGVGGMLAVVAETTARVQGERRLGILRELAARPAEAKTAEQACERSADVLARNSRDVPFALLYLVEASGKRARRVAAVGLDDVAPMGPAIVDLSHDDAARGWALAEVSRTRTPRAITDLPARFGRLPGGPYPEPTHTALVLPMLRPGQEHPYGFLVAGVSPRRALDDPYRAFFELATEHVATAIANARAYQEERSRAEALAALDRAKTAFFSNVSHEFRTPLTLMLGPTEDALAAESRALSGYPLQMVHRNQLRLLKLVNTLLEFSRIEAGRVEAVYEPTDLAVFTADLASAFRSAIEKAGLRLSTDLRATALAVYVDRGMWEKIVLNLLSNALKFTFVGEIAVGLRQVDHGVELSVRDTGVGVPAAEVPRLFERFHRVRDARARTHEGTGIGLALVQELVKLHGGSIRVETKVGEGTLFAVTIPTGVGHLPQDRIGAARAEASTSAQAAPYVEEALRWLPGPPTDFGDGLPVERAAPARADAAKAEARPRILVVDDNADMREYLARLLGERWSVEAVGDGDTALRVALVRPPSIVVSDVMMPGLDGTQLVAALRADERTATIPIILLSARAGNEASEEGLSSGANDYVVKPFSGRELVARVQSHLELARIRGEVARREHEARRELSDALARERHARALADENARIAETLSRLSASHATEVDLARQSLEAILERVPIPIVLIEPGTARMLFSNKAADELWGAAMPQATTAEDYGRLFRAVDSAGNPLPVDQIPAVRAARGEDVMGAELELETPQGRVSLLVDSARIPPLPNHPTTIVITLRDVTKLVATERALREAVHVRDEFLSVASHELNTPLTPLKLHLASLLATEWSDSVRRKLLVADRQVDRLAALVTELLEVSRITAGRLDMEPSRVDVLMVVRSAVEHIGGNDGGALITIGGAPAFADVDTGRLEQVVTNLVTNAIKYGEGKPIDIEVAREPGFIVVHVRDRGMGIAPEKQQRIFERFERAVSVRHFGGFGLGLWIVRQIVEAWGGQVSVSSSPGAGSTFSFSMPAPADA